MGAVVRIAVAEEVALLSFPKKPVNMISRLLCVALLSSVAVAAPQYYYPQHFAQQQLVLPQQLFHLQGPDSIALIFFCLFFGLFLVPFLKLPTVFPPNPRRSCICS